MEGSSSIPSGVVHPTGSSMGAAKIMRREEFIKIFDLGALGEESWYLKPVLKNDELFKANIATTDLLRKALARESGGQDDGYDFRWQESDYDEDFRISTQNRVRYGELTISECHPTEVKLRLASPGTIKVDLHFSYYIDVILRTREWRDPNSDKLTGRLQYPHWSFFKTMQIPISLIWAWMHGMLESPDPRITLISIEGPFLKYNTGDYPIALRRFFNSRRENALGWLEENSFINEETLMMISGIFNRLRENEPFVGDDREPDRDNIENQELRVQLRMDDRKKLVIIGNTRSPHSIREWTELLGFKSTGATMPFIDRMVEQVLISGEKLADGTLLTLTEKARRILNFS